MENLPSLLESIYTAWLSLSSTIWAMDMILAFVCGLGLYLLLVPFLESHLSSLPSNIKFTRKPQIQMTWQSQYMRNHCRNDEKAWGECLKKLKEKEKDELFLEEMSPGHHLNSLGNMFNSPSAKQDSTTLSPFWNLKEKSEEQMATQKLSYPKISGDHLQEKYDQLFWGLPSLHSESLAAAWIPQTTSTLPSPFFLFNVISSVYPIQLQDKMSPMLPHTHPLSYLDLQSPPLILSPLEFQSPALNQVHFQSPLPVLLPSSLPYSRDFGTSYSQSQSNLQCPPTEIQYRERPLVTTQLESRLTLPLMVQKSQETYEILTPNPSHDWAVPILPDNFPISCELRDKLEQHIQKWLTQHQWNFPPETRQSEDMMGLQNTVTGNYPLRDKPCTSQAHLSTGEREHSKQNQKVKFQLESESCKNLGPILGKIPKDPVRGLEKNIVKVQGANNLEPERILVKCLKSDSRNDSMNYIDRDLENNWKAHFGTKSGQIDQGLTPLSMRQSWLAMNDSFCGTDIHMETGNLTTKRSSEKFMCSRETLSFLNPETRRTLEEHVVRFWVKHRWGLPLRMLKPINLFKLKSESLPFTVCTPLSSTSSVPRTSSAVEVVRVLGQPCVRPMIIEDSSPSPGNLLLVSSPSCKRAVIRRLPSDVDHEPSIALPNKPQSAYLSETLTYNFMETPTQSGGVLKKKIETQEVLLLPRRTCAPNPRAHIPQAKVVSEFPYNVETELTGQPQIYTTPGLLPKRSRSTPLPVDTLASNALGDIVRVDRGSGLVQQRPSTPKHQVSQKGQAKILTPTYQGEDTKRQSERKYEDRSKFTPVKERKLNFEGQYYQTPPKTTQVLPESYFQRLLSRFLPWTHPKKAIKGHECHPRKDNLTPATAQNQRRQVRKQPYMVNNVTEAKDLMTAVGHMLEKKMMLQRQLRAPKVNQPRVVSPAPTSRFSHGHMPVSYLEQRRPPSYPANSSYQRRYIQDRHIRGQLPQKSVQFSQKPQTLRNPSHMYPKLASNVVNSSQNRTIVPGTPNQHLCCPRHCTLQRKVCRELGHASVVFPNRKT